MTNTIELAQRAERARQMASAMQGAYARGMWTAVAAELSRKLAMRMSPLAGFTVMPNRRRLLKEWL